jgi:hypothetical protein
MALIDPYERTETYQTLRMNVRCLSQARELHVHLCGALSIAGLMSRRAPGAVSDAANILRRAIRLELDRTEAALRQYYSERLKEEEDHG